MDKVLLTTFTIEELENLFLKVAQKVVEDAKKKEVGEEFITSKEAAKLLKISRTTLYNLTKYGKLNKYNINTSVRYKKSEVLELATSFYKYQR